MQDTNFNPFVGDNGAYWEYTGSTSKPWKVWLDGEAGKKANSKRWRAETNEEAQKARIKFELTIRLSTEVVHVASSTSAFKDEMYNSLPSPLKEAVSTLTSANEKAAFLVAAIAILSGVLPNVHGVYNGKEVHPNLYAYVLGNYGVGKGSLDYAKRLADPIHKARREESQRAQEVYQSEKAQYDIDLKDWLRDKTSGAKPEEPVRPPVLLLFLPANNSKTGLYQLLSENEQRGILYETEADALTDAMRSEHGRFSDGLRKAFHHEPITYFRRTGNETVEIDAPKLSVLLSSTYDQLINLIPTAENGLFSRFMFFELKGNDEFDNVFDDRKGQYTTRFITYGEQMKTIYNSLASRRESMLFELTRSQQTEFVKLFSALKKEFREFVSIDLDGTVHRMALIAFRVSMIISTLRHYENGGGGNKILCTESDFTLSLSIMETLKKTALSVYYRLPTSAKVPSIGSKKDDTDELMDRAKLLHGQGFSYRQVATELYGPSASAAHKSKVYYWINGRK